MKPLFVIVALGAALAAAPASGQAVIFVNAAATGANTGASWQDAYTDLQSGLSAATVTPGSAIWVAAGTYLPGTAGNRGATFVLPPQTALYGGFAGTETSLVERDPDARPTVLSGDIDQNDSTAATPWYATGYPGNSFHVVTATGVTSSTVLDGFEVSGGSALIGGSGFASGAGLLLTDASPVIRRCTLRFNYGSWGSAIGVTNGQPRFEDCTIAQNLGWNGRGGAVYIGPGTAQPIFSRCAFRSNQNICNSIDPAGGAIYIDFGAAAQTIEDCAFELNEAVTQTAFGFSPGRGGAIFNPIDGLVVRRCTFVKNHSHVGGAIESFRNVTIESCVFDANFVTPITATGGSTVGGIGGAVDVLGLVGQPQATIAGCTVMNNTATDECGGVYLSGTTRGTVHSCILRGNSDSNGMVGESQLKGAGASASDIESFLVPVPGEDPIDPTKFPSCIDVDPLFVDPNGPDNVPGTPDDDFRLLATSPCVDTGSASWAASGFDVAGSPRRLDGNLDTFMSADMGAHELDHVALTVSALPQVNGTPVRMTFSGTAGLPAYLFLGLPGPELVIPPVGPLFIAPASAVFLPLGALPASLSFFAPPLGVALEFQAAAFGGSSGNFSNPIALQL